MDEEEFKVTNSENVRPSYWLDPCEDISCDDFIHEFVDDLGTSSSNTAATQSLPAIVTHSEEDDNLDPCFFGGIDQILDSIKNGDGLPPHPSPTIVHPAAELAAPGHGDDNGHQRCSAAAVANTSDDKHTKGLSLKDESNGNKRRKSSWSEGNRDCHEGKRVSLSHHKDERRGLARKRPRDWNDTDCRSRDHPRRREQRKDMERRDGRGYWERDKEKNEMVFRLGSWEAERARMPMEKIRRASGMAENKPEEPNGKCKLPKEQARQYQLDVLEQAKQKNTIAFLETGAGKTLIAVLLIKSMSCEMQRKDKKLLAVFLVPKVPLVYQQAEVIRDQTGYEVGHYCGEMGQDFWDARRWQREFATKQVLVMTAQILLNILRHSIIKMDSIDLLILDECHHAVKKHPYSLVMSEFYHTTPKEKRPCVFGMTASPVNLKGVSSQLDCAMKIRNLETKLDSVVFTVKDRAELEKHVPMPSEIVVEYDKAATLWSLHEQIKQMEQTVEEAAQSSSRKSKWQFMGARDAGAKDELRQVYGVSERTESDGAANLIQKLRAINYALGELGQWCAYKVAQSFLAALRNDERANYQLDVKFQESYLKKVVSLLQCQLSEGAVSGTDSTVGDMDSGYLSDEIEEGELTDSHVVSGGEHVDVIIGAAVADGKVTPKVQSLVKILLKYQHTDDFRAIVFVERVVAALVLPKVFAELPSLSFIRSASLIGHNNSQEMRASQMQDTIAKFRDGRVTLLVATSVAEEGLDIRQCNVVIRFDLAKTVLAYIQSRGRARKPGSGYILMVERGNLSHDAFLRNARNSEETLRKEAIERTDISHLMVTSKPGELMQNAMYKVDSTGAVVSLNSAVGLIHFYCSQLPSDRYSILRPEFIMQRHEKAGAPSEYSCKLQLPCNAPFEELEGPMCSSMRLAQQAVCLSACKKLHEMGAFTDMLLPDKGSGENIEKSDEKDEGDPLPGTARHREFYPEGVAKVLQGEWILSGRENCDHSKLFRVYMYEIKCINIGYSKDPFLTQVSEFAVLFGNELDAEVLSMSMDLFIARTMIAKASLVYRGPLEITEIQLALLKSFHVRLMSIVLDVDVEPSTTPWDPAKAYLFVPMVTCSRTTSDTIKDIDWGVVESITKTDAWMNPLQRARPDVYLGTNERALGGDRREYGFGKLRHGMAFGLKSHPTYGIRGAVAQYNVVEASGLVPRGNTIDSFSPQEDSYENKLVLADYSCVNADALVGKIITAAHSGKRFFVDSVRFEMTAENSFPRKEGYLGPLEYSSYADYYKQKYGVELKFKQQPLIRARGVSYCKNLLSPRYEHSEGHENETDESLDKTYYVFLPPELCLVHPLPGFLVRGAQRLPSIMRRVESMLLAVELKHIIDYPVPSSKILEALTAASCQETFCYERAELLGDAYLKWVVSRFLFLKYPQKHEGQLTRMRQQMVSNMVLYQFALSKGLQSYIQADRFAPSRWAAPGVLPVFDEDVREGETSLFSENLPTGDGGYDDDEGIEDGELEEESDSSSYRVLSSKTLADVVEALIGVYYVEEGKNAANHLMKWIGIEVDFDLKENEYPIRPSSVPENILRSINFDMLEASLNFKFVEKSLLVEAITHASRPSSGVSCYQRLEFVGDAVLDHLITRHLFFTYTDLPPGRLTDLRAAAVNNENFARVAVKHNLHIHLRHGSSALEKQIKDFVKEARKEMLKPGFNSFGLGDCKAPKVLGDIIESIAGAIFLDSKRDTAVVWKVFRPLLEPMVTPETLPMHPVRELQERCQQQAEGLEYKASRSGNVATVEVYVDGIQVGAAQNSQKKMAQKLAARNALVTLKEREEKEGAENSKKVENETGDDHHHGNGILGKRKRNGSQTFTRQTLNDICLRRNWPMPLYRCVHEGGPAHAKRFTFAVSVNTSDRGWTDECIGEPMPSVKKAKDSAAVLLLELLNKTYSS
ncbi:OLC1v1002075C1 [Oldenlandia corymbosa var. corymbosa]|uniref:Endoribonuclease Dicer homolog 1 n=1 Tax=Oldenlandia corymbosa var. corymbosa TaxID=529605 RepID=A0AAV1D6R3_OLDCO|nr:OLC1v1002075C1 [Oldenlandia corymbosa var. corymbosa]